MVRTLKEVKKARKEYEKSLPAQTNTNNKKNKKWYEEIVNVDRFKEIDSVGDFFETVGGTAFDVAGNAFQGIFQGAEGLSDFARNRYADAVDTIAKGTAAIGWDSASKTLKGSAKEAREIAKQNETQEMVDAWEHIISGDLGMKKPIEELNGYEKVQDKSIIGDVGREGVQSIALNMTTAGLNAASGGALGLPLIAVSAAGNAEQEALKNNATLDEARTYGLLMGGIEAGTEMFFGGLGKISEGLGFGKGAIDDQLLKRFTKSWKSTAAKNITSFAVKSIGEGSEEVLAGLGGAIAQKLTYMSEEDIEKLIEDQDLMKSFIMGTLSSTIMQAPSTITSTAQGRDVNTGLTQVQQQYVNEIAQQRIAEAQKRNEKLNRYQQMKIEDRTLEDYQKGRLFDSSRLPMSEDLKKMDLQQSAYKHGINPNSEAVVNIKTALDKRGIKSRFDADAFKESNENAFWSNNNGAREVVFNPNANMDVILEEVAIHEMTHDLMSSSNSESELNKQKILDYVSTLDGYAEAKQRVENKYKKQIRNKTKADAEAYINEEIVADVLGKNIGSQEYIRQLVDSQPSLSKVIYNWIVKTVNNLANTNGVKKEKLYWENIKNSFEKAYNMDWEGKGNKDDTKLAKGTLTTGEEVVVSDDILGSNPTNEEVKNVLEKMIGNKYYNKSSNSDIGVDETSVGKYLYDGYNNPKNAKLKKRIAGNYGEILELAKINTDKSGKENYKNSNRGKEGYDYYEVKLAYPIKDNNNKILDYRVYTGRLVVRKESNGDFTYDIDRIKEKKGAVVDKNNLSILTDKTANNGSFIANNIAQPDDNVKYSLSETPKQDNQGRELSPKEDADIRYSLGDYQEYTNEINATLEKAKNLDEKFYNDLIAQQEEYKERHQLEYNILEETNSRPATNKNINSDFFKEHRSEYDGNSGQKLADGILTVMHLQKGDNLAKLSFTEGEDKIWIDELYVKNQKQGYGSEIVNAIKKYAEENGKYVEAFKELSTAKGFWDKTLRNNDVRYSLSDNQGRELTKEQQEYFKNSKVRDTNGSLQTVYHGSPNQFTEFSYDYIGTNGTALGKGFYLTDSFSMAEGFAGNGNKPMELYVNITKPMSLEELTISKGEFKKFVNEIAKQDEYFIYDYGDVDREGFNKILNYAVDLNYDNETNDVDLIHGILNTSTLGWEDGFRVLNKTLGYDGVIKHYDAPIDQATGESNVYVPFFPEQIKNVNNLNPTDDVDIRKSKQNEGWQSFLDNNFEPRGTKTKLGDIKLPGLQDAIQEEVQTQTQQALLPIANELKELNKNLNKVMNPTEIAQLTPQDANTTPNLPGVTRNKESDGKSKFFDNVNNKVGMLNDKQKAAILSDEDVKYYDKVTNKESLDKAFERLQEDGANESLRWFNKNSENADATDVAEGWILLKQYADSGNTEGMVEVAKKLREIGTKAGQTVQAFNILSRLTPEGMVKYAQSELMEAYDIMVKNKSAKWIEENRSKFELKPEEVQFIMDTMKDVSTMEDGYDKKFKLAQIQKIMTDKLPPEKGAGMKAWMRISMLFNPKTQVRNVAGNAIIAPVNAFGDFFASAADKLISSKTGVRTTGNINLKNYAKGMGTGLYQSYNDFKHGVNTRNIEGNRFEISQGKAFKDTNPIGKALNKVDRLLSFMLDAGDRGFYEAAFTNSINNQLVLNNTTEVTQDMIDIATQEALSRTWQDNNKYTKFVMSIRNQLNQINVAGYGLGDVLIPFAKTPANLTKAIVDYSPAGLIGTINKGVQLKKSLTNGQYSAQMQHDFVQSLGKAVAGTMLYVAGIALANAGVTTGESDEDKDTANFLKNTLGINSYSIKIGDRTFTYDWAQPIAAPLAITANLVQKQKEEATLLENITSTLDTAGNLLLEQSFMESISTVLNNNEGIATGIQEAILDLPARAVPTLFKQIVDITDGTQRQSFVKGKPIESSINAIKAKIPGLSQTLSPSVDTLGRDIEKYGGKNNIFNVFINPANVNTENVSESAAEIYKVYKATGETSVMPRVAPYTITIDDKKINLSAEDRTEYQRISGEIIENNVQNLISTIEYNNLPDKEKAEVIKNIVNYSYNIAQKEMYGKDLSDAYENAYEYSQIGDVSDYYTFKASIDDTNAQTKKTSIKEYLVNSYLNDEQIAKLYGAYYSSESELSLMLNAKVPMKEYVKFNSEEFVSDYNNKGNAITNSRRNKMINYINGLNLNQAQKVILIKTEYSSFNDYDNVVFNYINKLPDSAYNKMVMLKKVGFDDYDNQIIAQVNAQNISREEKIKKLKEMGFTIRNGRVYS